MSCCLAVLLLCFSLVYGYDSKENLQALKVLHANSFLGHTGLSYFCEFQNNAVSELFKKDSMPNKVMKAAQRIKEPIIFTPGELIFVCGEWLGKFLKSASNMGKNNLAFVYIERNWTDAVSSIIAFKPRLDQQILLFNTETMCLVEYYYIKSSEFTNKLICDFDLERILSFLAGQSIVTRRLDFNSTLFTVATSEDDSNMNIEKDLDSPEREIVETERGRLVKLDHKELSGKLLTSKKGILILNAQQKKSY